MKEEKNTEKHKGSLIKNLNEAIEPDEVLSGSIVGGEGGGFLKVVNLVF